MGTVRRQVRHVPVHSSRCLVAIQQKRRLIRITGAEASERKRAEEAVSSNRGDSAAARFRVYVCSSPTVTP